MKPKLVVIVGPTAVGKTKLSIELSKAFDGEVINGDSMQVYKELDIGTAKITEEEAEGIPHHLIDFLPPECPYTVKEFQNDVRRLVPEITNRGKLPIMVGGTGLYVKAATHNYQFTNEHEDAEYREHLQRLADKNGAGYLHHQLNKVDPESAASVHPNNVKRVIRALEIYHVTGKLKSEHEKNQELDPVYDLLILGLTMDRPILYDRINSRVDQMIEAGLIDEAYSLFNEGIKDVQSVQAIGYKELYDYFKGQITLDDAILQIKRNTRRFAKRQFTWFENQMDVHWFDMTNALVNFNKKAEEITKFVAGKYDLKSK